MPLPKPKKDESHDDFMDRCMGDDVMNKEYPDEKQRYAVCQSQWDNKKSEQPEGLERRIFRPEEIELRIEDDEKPKLVGYAARYNSWTDLGFFKERIKANAFSDALDNDVRCLKNHDPNLILGRTTNGTLSLESNTVGLRFTDELPDTSTGRDVREEVRRGDISGCSFAFTVSEDDWKYFDDDRPPERTIVKIGQLFDVGPVTYPAYPDTTVAARSLDPSKCAAFYEAHKDQLEELRWAENEDETENEITDRKRLRQIERDYRKAGRIINRCKSTED